MRDSVLKSILAGGLVFINLTGSLLVAVFLSHVLTNLGLEISVWQVAVLLLLANIAVEVETK